MSKKGVVVAKSSGMVVGTGARHGLLLGSRAKIYGLCAAVLLVIAGAGTGVYVYKKHADKVHRENVAKQRDLQKSVSDVNAVGDVQKLKTDSNNLINGAKNGTYNVSDEQLAAAYVSRADAELNTKDYRAALADYQKAAQLDSSQKTAAQYGEFMSRYRLGERKTLIPLLEQLKQSLQKSDEPMSGQQLGLYSQYIADLQAGKDLDI